MNIAELQSWLTPERLDAAVAPWSPQPHSLRFIRAMENFVYEFTADGRPLILRLTHNSHRTTAQLEAELEFVDFLGRQDVSVARAIPSRRGRLLERLAVNDTYFSAAVFEKAPGKKPAFDLPPDAQTAFFRDWGGLLGAMHRCAPRYREGRGDPRRHVGIEDDIFKNAAQYLPSHHQALVTVLSGLLAEIRAFPTTPLHYGLLHTDCHHGNFHASDRRLTLFDFDDCCHHWNAFDLAVPLWHFPVGERGQDPARDRAVQTRFFQEFIRGYQDQNPFQPEWLDQMRIFLRLRDLQLFIFAWKTWDQADPQAWQSQFMRERGDRIQAGQPSVDLNWSELTL